MSASDPADGTALPPIDPRLVEVLGNRFPERCPNPSDSEREIWMKAGERRLVTWLAHHLAQQQEDPFG